MDELIINWANLIALAWLILNWVGYTYLAKKRAKTADCIAFTLHTQRRQWMESMLDREQRIADTALLASLERHVTFFASTTILILAGLLTLFSTTEYLFSMVAKFPLATPSTPLEMQLKLLFLLAIFIYAFFTFTWSMRQYGFCSVLMGAAPQYLPPEQHPPADQEQRISYMKSLAKVIDQAGHSYNYGLRSYYFAMATLAWFISPWLFMGATTLVVAILYQREFHSPTLKVMLNLRRDQS